MLVKEVRSHLLPRRKIPLPTNSATIPTVNIAVVIPAYNEELGIAQTIRSLQSCDHPINNPLEDKSIIVVADNCTDQTAKVAEQLGVRVFERIDTEKRGKGYALNAAFRFILDDNNDNNDDDKFDAVIVVDADTVVDKNFIMAFTNLFANGELAAQARYQVKNTSLGGCPRTKKLLQIP